MNKKLSILLLLISLAAVFPLSAQTHLVNTGYEFHFHQYEEVFSSLGYENTSFHSVNLNFINLTREDHGFYFQMSPYYGILAVMDSDTLVLPEIADVFTGSDFIFGYGMNNRFGKTGILWGGGFMMDLNVNLFAGLFMFESAVGAGGGLNFYFHPGKGRFLLNIGLNGAWKPFHFIMSTTDILSAVNWKLGSLNINLGIGWS